MLLLCDKKVQYILNLDGIKHPNADLTLACNGKDSIDLIEQVR